MLRILRIENTITYVIVEQKREDRACLIHGYVNIAPCSEDDEFITFHMQEISWIATVKNLCNEKREELYGEIFKDKKIVHLTPIVMQYFLMGNAFCLDLPRLRNLISHINNKIEEKGKADEYIVPLRLNLVSVEKMLENNSEVVSILDSRVEYNSCLYFSHCSEDQRQKLEQQYPVDNEIKEIIQDFIKSIK